MRSQPEVPSFHREGYSQFGGGLEFIRHQIAALGGGGSCGHGAPALRQKSPQTQHAAASSGR